MTDLATIARDNALSVEAKKHGYRQSKDGIVVSFVLHPQDVPDDLAIADLGTRYMMVLVALNDDETPKEVMPPESNHGPTDTRPDPVINKPPDRAVIRKPVAAEKRLAQRAGILCGDPVFQRFLQDEGDCPDCDEKQATTYVRLICGVSTRADIIPGTPAGNKFEQLDSRFKLWNYGPQYVEGAA